MGARSRRQRGRERRAKEFLVCLPAYSRSSDKNNGGRTAAVLWKPIAGTSRRRVAETKGFLFVRLVCLPPPPCRRNDSISLDAASAPGLAEVKLARRPGGAVAHWLPCSASLWPCPQLRLRLAGRAGQQAGERASRRAGGRKFSRLPGRAVCTQAGGALDLRFNLLPH